jgi:ADP-heptose:LPS heptosyltransferase
MTTEQKLLIDLYIGRVLQLLLKPVVVLVGRVFRPDHDLSRCRDIAIIKMLGGGSLVIAYPDLLALKTLPHVRRLVLLTTPAVKQFAEALQVFDEIFVIRDNSLLLCIYDGVIAWRRLFCVDAIVDFEIHSRLTTIFSLICCAKNRIGFYTADSFWRRNISTHLIFCNVASGVYHFYDQIVHLFQGNVPQFEDAIRTFRATRTLTPSAVADVALHTIAVAPCCSGFGQERMMLDTEWADVLSRKIAQQKKRLEMHFLGGPNDREYIDKIMRLLPSQHIILKNQAGQLRLNESVDLIAVADEMVCIDSGLLHFARLLGVPTTSFWGPSDPSTRLRPRCPSKDIVHYTKVPCSPCVHMAQSVPCHGDNICMRFAVNPKWSGNANTGWLACEIRPYPGTAIPNTSIAYIEPSRDKNVPHLA